MILVTTMGVALTTFETSLDVKRKQSTISSTTSRQINLQSNVLPEESESAANPDLGVCVCNEWRGFDAGTFL
eukprot:2036539-Amphidinium_carterae.2